MSKRKRLFYDIETSFCEGHFWRPGYNQTIRPEQITNHGKIICISWKWEGEDKIHNTHWGLHKQCDKSILKKFIKELDKADEIVAHNGDRFDIKWIRTRAIFHGLDMRPHYNSIDTLKLCKKYFNFHSNKLAEVADFLKLEAKKDSGGLNTWIDIIYHKNQEALDRMLWYCDGDITTLEAVYNAVRQYTQPRLHYGVMGGGDKFQCPECSSTNVHHHKRYATAQGTIQHYMRCGDDPCKSKYKINNKQYQEWLTFKMINGIK